MNSSFYLRPGAKRGSNKPSLIYFCVSDGKDKQYKISMGVKLLDSQWNSKKQEPIISNLFSVEANKCALMCFERIMQVKCVYLQYLNYLCTTNEVFSIDELKESIREYRKSKVTSGKERRRKVKTDDRIINNPIIYSKCTNKDTQRNKAMKGKTTFLRSRNYKATTLIDRALKQHIEDNKVKETTAFQYRSVIQRWQKWVIDVNKSDGISCLKQAGIDKYIDYLKKMGKSNVEINKVAILRLLINTYIAKIGKYGIGQIIFTRLKDKRRSEDRLKVELLDDEIERIENAELPKKLNLWRDIFCLAIYTGQRASDIYQLLKGDYTRTEEGTIIIRTKKRDKDSYILNSPIVNKYLALTEGKIKTNETSFKINLNTKIKTICKMIGIDREITYTDAHHTKQTDKLCNIISSHFARHTFTTKKVREGYSFEEVGKMIGDTGQIVELTYSHLTRQDHIDTLHKAQERIRHSRVPSPKLLQGRNDDERDDTKDVNSNRDTIIYKDGTTRTPTNQPLDRAIGYIENNSKEPQRVIEYLRQNNISINQLIRYYSELMGINRNDGIVYDLDSTMEFLVKLLQRRNGA